MKYAKWKLLWQGDPSEGFGAQSLVDGRGDSMTGIFFEGDGNPHNFIYGYLNDDFDFDGLDTYEFTEVTQDEILAKAQQIDAHATLDAQGFVIFPRQQEA